MSKNKWTNKIHRICVNPTQTRSENLSSCPSIIHLHSTCSGLSLTTCLPTLSDRFSTGVLCFALSCLSDRCATSKQFFIFSSRFHRPYQTEWKLFKNQANLSRNRSKFSGKDCARSCAHLRGFIFVCIFRKTAEKVVRMASYQIANLLEKVRQNVEPQSSNLIQFDGYTFWIGPEK